MNKKRPLTFCDFSLNEKSIVVKNHSLSPNLSRKRLQQIPLSTNCLQVLLGGLLGDGHLSRTKGYKNARYQMRHSIVQQEYFEWKVNHLKEICTEKSVQIQPADGWSSQKKNHIS